MTNLEAFPEANSDDLFKTVDATESLFETNSDDAILPFVGVAKLEPFSGTLCAPPSVPR